MLMMICLCWIIINKPQSRNSIRGTPHRFGVCPPNRPALGQLSASSRPALETFPMMHFGLFRSLFRLVHIHGFLFQTCPQTTKASQCINNCLSGILKVDEILFSGLRNVPAILVSATHWCNFGLAMVCHQGM